MRASRSSAVVTKFLSAFAGHSRTAVISFNPKFAARTLLVLRALHELDKVLIVFIKTIIDLILSTGHSVMVLTSASQTIVLLACRTTIVIQLQVELKHSLASSCRTPCSWCIVLLYELIEGEFLKLLLKVSIYVAIDIAHVEMLVAALHWTDHIHFILLDFALEVSVDALGVENMTAFKDSKRIPIDLRAAYGALPTLWFCLLCYLLYLFLFFL